MDKFSINNETNKDKYDSLKKDLLNNTISIEELIDKLMEWDQSTSSREASDKNLVFLLDSQIVKYIKENPEKENEYYYFLSFTEFHVAQRLISNNSADAIEHFKKAFENAKNQIDESWTAYVEGSILYLEGKEIPEEIIKKTDSIRNAQILRNFNKGLKERRSPSYLEDYIK